VGTRPQADLDQGQGLGPRGTPISAHAPTRLHASARSHAPDTAGHVHLAACRVRLRRGQYSKVLILAIARLCLAARAVFEPARPQGFVLSRFARVPRGTLPVAVFGRGHLLVLSRLRRNGSGYFLGVTGHRQAQHIWRLLHTCEHARYKKNEPHVCTGAGREGRETEREGCNCDEDLARKSKGGLFLGLAQTHAWVSAC